VPHLQFGADDAQFTAPTANTAATAGRAMVVKPMSRLSCPTCEEWLC
jgi:hypothetical protein